MTLVPSSASLSSLDEHQQRRILQTLSLDPANPLTQALLLVADKYSLDPLLKQVQIIKGSVYITHKGLLHIAHTSGKLDGIMVLDETMDTTYFRAKVSVFRKDMTHPFTYSGEYAKSRVRSDGASGREMALKNAERAALARAFDVAAPTMDDNGTEFDHVEPGTDISLPPGQPALPSPETNALPVPESWAPENTTMPAPTPMEVPEKKARAPRKGKVAVVDVPVGVDTETGEVIDIHARAKAIAAETEAAAAERTPGEPLFTPEQIKRGQVLHMVAKEQGIEEALLRDVVEAISGHASTRKVSQDEADTIRAILVGIGSGLVDLAYTPDGKLILPSTIEDAVIVEENGAPTDWKAIADLHSIKQGVFLRRARAIAEEIGATMPSSFGDINKDPVLEKAIGAWLAEFSSTE